MDLPDADDPVNATGFLVHIPKIKAETFDDPQAMSCFMMGAQWAWGELALAPLSLGLREMSESDPERCQALIGTINESYQVQAYKAWEDAKRVGQMDGDKAVQALRTFLETIGITLDEEGEQDA